ncbi:metalloendopeptidase [Fragilaria crotonensis]|nr:metalloendopeptidase [Fragilaria crotonensis]
MFGTRYWVEDIANETLEQWSNAATPQLPPSESMLALPPKNPFVPEKLALKLLPEDDSDHPLLNSSLKLCISVGKRKSWFPATMVKYNATMNTVLLSYEDEDEKWHVIDHEITTLTVTSLVPGFEGTLDKKSIKFRLVSLAKDGARAVLKYGDDSDFEVQDGSLFPAIPPALSESRLPKLIYNRPELKLWHLQDRKFKRPIAELRLRLICGGANKTPLHQACSDLLVSLCTDAVTEVSYLASVCDLASTVSSNDLGFSVRVHGFDDKLLALFLEIFSVLLSFRGRSATQGLPDTVLEGRFDACLEVLMRKYENSGLKPSHLASQVRIKCLRSTSWSAFEKSEAIKGITESAFTEIITEVMSSVSAEALYHGNVDIDDALAARDAILACLATSGGAPIANKGYPTEPVIQFPLKPEPFYAICPTKNVVEPNTAVEVYFQVGKDNITDRVTIDMLTHMMAEPLYDQLRTKDQFGYSVSCDSRWTCGIMGIHFVVVSSTKSADEITKRIDTFLQHYKNTLVDMKDEQFMEHLVGLAKNKLEMFNSLSEETGCYWSEIQDRRFDWEVYRNEALALRSITKKTVITAFDKWLLPCDKDGKMRDRRALVVQVIGNGGEACAEGRPCVGESESIPAFVDEQVRAVHASVGGATWGKVY